MKKTWLVAFSLVIITLTLSGALIAQRSHKVNSYREEMVLALTNQARVDFYDGLVQLEDILEHLKLAKSNPDYLANAFGSPEYFLAVTVPDVLQGLECQLYLLVSYAHVLYPDEVGFGIYPSFELCERNIIATIPEINKDTQNLWYMLEWTTDFFNILRDSYYVATNATDNSSDAHLQLLKSLYDRYTEATNMFNFNNLPNGN